MNTAPPTKSRTAEQAVRVDEFNLDKDCINLPSDILKFSNAAADARRDVNELKSELEVVQSDLGKKIRKNPGTYGIEKLTESAVSDVVKNLPEYKKALLQLQDAQYELDLANAVVSALEAKRRALAMLVELHGLGYFSNVKVSKEGRDAVNDMTQRAVRRRHQED